MTTLDWHWEKHNAVVNYGSITVRTFFDLSHTNDVAIDLAKRLTRELRALGYDISRRGHWVYFSDVALDDFALALSIIGVDWQRITTCVKWRLVQDLTPPEPKP